MKRQKALAKHIEFPSDFTLKKNKYNNNNNDNKT